MEQVWTFLGTYWWLVFPLMGVAGGAARAWERGAKRRHERRLESMRLTAELGAVRSATPAHPLSAAEDDQTDAARLTRLLAAHDAVTARWLEYELDVAKLIAYPAMSDGRQPLTAAFLRAKRLADNLRPAGAKDRMSARGLAEYRDAVTDYEVAFDVAERDARRVRDSSFSTDERKRLDVAKQLLTVAVDEAATPAERQLAYRRVREELDGLLSLSDGAIEVLEKRVALELPAGAPSAAPPAVEPDASAPGIPSTASIPRPSSAAPAPSAPSPSTAPGRVIRPRRPA